MRTLAAAARAKAEGLVSQAEGLLNAVDTAVASTSGPGSIRLRDGLKVAVGHVASNVAIGVSFRESPSEPSELELKTEEAPGWDDASNGWGDIPGEEDDDDGWLEPGGEAVEMNVASTVSCISCHVATYVHLNPRYCG